MHGVLPEKKFIFKEFFRVLMKLNTKNVKRQTLWFEADIYEGRLM